MTAAMPKVVICIVAFRNPADILACLDALSVQTFQEFAVVICENGSPEDFSALQDAVPIRLAGGQPVTVINDPDNPGYAGGVNRCIAAAGPVDAYWVLNPDTEPHPDALGALVERLEQGDVDAAGGVMTLPDGRISNCGARWNRLLAYSTSIGRGFALSQVPSAAVVERRLSFICGGSLLCSRRFIERAGLMREDYFLYGEEVEWCLRARRRGLRLGYSAGAVVLHHQGSSTGSGKDFGERGRLPIYCDERNRILTLRDTTPWLLPLAIWGALATIVLRYGKRRAWAQLRIAVRAWADGVHNRRGKPSWL